jgi:HAD superfamily hydrolase (TIGR01509 family)
MTGGVLWDLDGTLVDSEDYHWRSWRDTMRGDGVVISHDQFLASFGQRNDRILTAWLGDGIDPDRMRRLGDAKELEYRRLAQIYGLAPLPGAAEWLARLHAKDWKQAIASSAPRENVDVMLRVLGLTPYFDAIVSAEDVTKGKPDPQVFLAAAFRLHLPPSRCVVVEDAPAGIEGARRAGMRSIGVSRTSALSADVFTRSLAELPEGIFESLIRGHSNGTVKPDTHV